jgi:rhodanese-related sulfurtransferase
MHTVTVHEAHRTLGTEGHCLLDVRTEAEVAALAAPGILNIPLDRLAGEAEKLAGYTSLHVICRSGGRSGMAVGLLHQLGMTHALNVEGGMLAWEDAGLPVE